MLESDHFSHGYYRIECKQRLLVAVLKGGWNLETAKSFCDDFKMEAPVLCDHNWGHLVYLDEWELGVPGVDEIIKPLVSWCIENGLTHAAHVYGDRVFSQNYVDRIVQNNKVFEKRVFRSDVDAINWLAEQGYCLSQ